MKRILFLDSVVSLKEFLCLKDWLKGAFRNIIKRYGPGPPGRSREVPWVTTLR